MTTIYGKKIVVGTIAHGKRAPLSSKPIREMKMANMNDLAERLRKANPTNKPMRLSFMARIFWPDRDEAWLNKQEILTLGV